MKNIQNTDFMKSSLSRRSFIRSSALTLAGAGLMGQTGLIGQAAPVKMRSGRSADQKHLNVNNYSILEGRGCPQDRELAVRSRAGDQYPNRISLALAHYDT